MVRPFAEPGTDGIAHPPEKARLGHDHRPDLPEAREDAGRGTETVLDPVPPVDRETGMGALVGTGDQFDRPIARRMNGDTPACGMGIHDGLLDLTFRQHEGAGTAAITEWLGQGAGPAADDTVREKLERLAAPAPIERGN